MPEIFPVTTPVPEPTVAAEVLLLLHTPLAEASVSVIVDPTQTSIAPKIAAGDGYTVTVIVVKQVVGNV